MNMTKVHVIAGRKPDPDLIELLRDLLALAEDGKLCALVGIAEQHDGTADYLTAGNADWNAIAGRLLGLAVELTCEEDED